MVGWHHRLHGHEFEQALGVGDGQGGLACCGPWGRKESDTIEQLNNRKILKKKKKKKKDKPSVQSWSSAENLHASFRYSHTKMHNTQTHHRHTHLGSQALSHKA